MGKAYTPNIKSDKGKNLTKYVAEFVKKNKDVPIIAFDHTVNKDFWIKRFKKDFFSLLLLKK